ncbi:MAG: twin-arginine translocation signal domain-containing protein [Deltaproteobacteria bacterium]|uniref:Acg family FMN-binding oxidoreductase n=1 Tax=Desulfobacula sp. TaxID=2593537 RepID=UPI0019BE0FB9|nr:twin-arginine translocation signal domain-containing protein [Candidatus Desulfobacula maris]MBL6994443.1 twin-arginine translocation signal domain-containing protein [Desulfobacula sp.]
MDRRKFLKKSAAATTLVLGSGLFLPACERNLRSELMGNDQIPGAHAIETLDPVGYKILYYASYAPSGHNSQPWFVKINSPLEWVLGFDADRCLKIVDGSNRETLLSLGAFVENLIQAAGAFGYTVETKVIAKDRFDSDVVKIHLSKSKAVDIALQRILKRRTVKSHLQSKELKPSDVNAFSKSADGHLFYFPVGTDHANFMNKEAVENYIIQADNKKAMEELASWIRLKDTQAKKLRDGLTPDGMEITGLAGWYVRHFMENKDVMTKAFNDKGIQKTKEQVKEGAGWIVITSDGNTVKDLIETGRRFQRMALTARGKMIGIHPMTQALEEKHGQKNIKENHAAGVIPQFMLRVGYLNKYPDPVSLRRPVQWFVRV